MTQGSKPPRHSIGISGVLGLGSAVMLGATTAAALGVTVLAGEVLHVSGPGAPAAFGVALLFFLPMILAYAELAAQAPAASSPYEISRVAGSARLAFGTAWLSLGGYLALASLLTWGLATHLNVFLGNLLELAIPHAAVVGVVVTLVSLRLVLGGSDRFAPRTTAVAACLTIATLAIVASLFDTESESSALSVKLADHWLTSVAMLAAMLWAVISVLDHRGQLERPRRTLLPAMVLSLVVGLALGAAVCGVVLSHPGLLMSQWAEHLDWQRDRVKVLFLAAGMALEAMALTRSLEGGSRLVGSMARDGFLPRRSAEERRRDPVAPIPLIGVACVIALLASLLGGEVLVTLAAIGVLWPTVAVLVPHALRPKKELAEKRAYKMPLHPMVPGLAAGAAAYLSWLLPGHGALYGGLWVAAGALFYLFYAQKGAIVKERRAHVVGDEAETLDKEGYRVLVVLGPEGDRASLLRLGAALARAHEGTLYVLALSRLVERRTLRYQRELAAETLADLERLTAPLKAAGLAVNELVRVAPSLSAAVLATSAEYNVDQLVMGADANDSADPDRHAEDEVFERTGRPLVLLYGRMPVKVKTLTVGASGGAHAAHALALAAEVADEEARLRVMHVVPRTRKSGAEEALHAVVSEAAVEREIEEVVEEGEDVWNHLLEETWDDDLLLLGASVDRLFERTVLEGPSLEAAIKRRSATAIVKRAESTRTFVARRLWEFVTQPFPTLSVSERSQVFTAMRHAGRASVDFYVLMTLASFIAVLGLVLDSGAVIIGAMLVAPLMSPILCLAHGIVQGNMLLLRRGASTTVKGVAVAIGVATIFSLLLPVHKAPAEVLARAHPNLLDLLVALAAGSIAAYGASRKSIASALPGVAIAVALVPPLCVVGYGLGTSRFLVAGGALLLFATNLAAITLAGATTFLMLGFRPTLARRGDQARKSVVLATVALMVLVIPLGLQTRSSLEYRRVEARVEAELARASSDGHVRFVDVVIEVDGGGVTVRPLVLSYESFGATELAVLRRRLEDAAGVPLRLQATVVRASLEDTGE